MFDSFACVSFVGHYLPKIGLESSVDSSILTLMMAVKSLFGAMLVAQMAWGDNIQDVGLDYVTLKGRVNDADHSWDYLGIDALSPPPPKNHALLTQPGTVYLGSIAYKFETGIPFAQAGRFEHAQLYNESLGVFDASEYGAICPQMSTGSILTENSNSSLIFGAAGVAIGPIVGDLVDTLFNAIGDERGEDCLFINVQTPQNITADAKLPVLLWM